MEITQAFDPFKYAVEAGAKTGSGSKWVVMILFLAIVAVVGYFLYKTYFMENELTSSQG